MGSKAHKQQDDQIRDALREGRPARAYWYSVALGHPAHVQDILETLALGQAIAVEGDSCAMRVREILTGYDIFASASEAWLLKIVAAAAARVALRMPFSPATGILEDTCELLGDECPSFLHAIRQATRHGVELRALQERHVQSLADLASARDAALQSVRTEFDLLGQRRTRAHRASRIWRQLLTSKGELGSVVTAILEGDPGGIELAEGLLTKLQDNKDIDRVIDALDAELHPVAAGKSKITTGAREDLRELTVDLLDSLRMYVEAANAVHLAERQRRATEATDVLDVLVRSVAADEQEIENSETPPGEDAALLEVKRWVRRALQQKEQLPTDPSDPDLVLGRDLLFAFELDRDSRGLVDRASVTVEVLQAVDARSAQEAYEGLVARDDHNGAELLIEHLRETGSESLAAELAERQRNDIQVSRERLRVLLDETDRELSLALATALMSESESSALRAEVEQLRAEQSVDFPTARRTLKNVLDRIADARDVAVEAARRQLTAVSASEESITRIERLLDQGDLINAQEFLAHLEAGARDLPREVDPDATLTRFWPDFSEAMEASVTSASTESSEADSLETLIEQRAQVGDTKLATQGRSLRVQRGIEGWLSLARDKRAHGYKEHLRHVLGMMGLDVQGEFHERERGQRLRWWTDFQATRVGQALVPDYGSASEGRYQLLLSWDRISPEVLLDLVRDRPPKPPVIVLSFRTLSVRERRALAERSRPYASNVSAVVVDPAVIAFLATRNDPAFHTTLGITLPFTSVNPYTPFVLGDVPPEVFYGRKIELGRVQDPQDALFVYGGRQLGKSALLKTAQREFQESNADWRSIYVDLKAEGIGEWRQPDDVWAILVPSLVIAGVLPSKQTSKSPPDHIVSGIRRWLDEDAKRRLLLLLDEADAFLGTDAQPRRGTVGEARFANVYRLKSLMDGTGRRFKPVFAGLHQVQRFHTTSNGPMAHVGAEIPVGPLQPTEAFKLVVKPLAAIGYHFESADAVWRLLNYTNYHPSLIQLFCDALVRRLHEQRLTAEAPPTTVTKTKVEEVYSDKGLRDQIAARFEWTINLDSRYRVIAYATAWLSVSGDEPLFSPVNLHDECSTFWPDGFGGLTLDEFVAYLDEMVGLGVLVRTPDGHYAIRSPNVVRLLGSREEIERRLIEADKLELSPSFDPAWYRRALHGDPTNRSPMPEQELRRLLEDGSHVHVVRGSEELGIGRVPMALSEAADEVIEVHVVSRESLQKTLTSLARRKGRHHIVTDLLGEEPAAIDEALRKLARQVDVREQLTASALVGLGSQIEHEGVVRSGHYTVTTLLPWTDESLKAWAPECVYPLASHADRHELVQATGGWPSLVESVVAEVTRGTPAPDAREFVVEQLEVESSRKEFLGRIGLVPGSQTEELAKVLATWSEDITFADLRDLVDWEPVDLVERIDRLVEMAVLRRTASGDTYQVNPLVVALLKPTS